MTSSIHEGPETGGPSSVSFWTVAHRKFDHLSGIVRNAFLENQDEAIGVQVSKGDWRSTSPLWDDPEAGGAVPAWTMISFVNGLDQDLLRIQLDAAKALLPRVENGLRAAELSDEFLIDWSNFCHSAAGVEVAYLARQSLGNRRQGRAGGRAVQVASEPHDIWFSRQFLALRKKGRTRAHILEQLRCLIVEAISDPRKCPAGITIEWLEHFVIRDAKSDNYQQLRDRYLNDISIQKATALAASEFERLPPLLKVGNLR
jgi:hypothetical protein